MSEKRKSRTRKFYEQNLKVRKLGVDRLISVSMGREKPGGSGFHPPPPPQLK